MVASCHWQRPEGAIRLSFEIVTRMVAMMMMMMIAHLDDDGDIDDAGGFLF